MADIPNCGNLVGADWVGNPRWDHKEPSMHFRKDHTELSIHFSKDHTELNMHFRKDHTEPSMHFRKNYTEQSKILVLQNARNESSLICQPIEPFADKFKQEPMWGCFILFIGMYQYELTTVRTTWPGCLRTQTPWSMPTMSWSPIFKCLYKNKTTHEMS